MGSRRVVTRSYSGDGRSGFNNGDDVTGSSRASGLSYLSGVRPENSQSRHRYSQYWQSRSTLCSVMAHLTEETQPSFETTLKSRAVSETSNVKFICVVTGNPAPEVTWYKDDIQLDRYCGLPKYEVSRNGQNHSLHIYNCTLEDAAIYQASARNSKGIVSCSGVLEVGTMSEYKIHQQYFAKLKQKAENKRKELEAPKLWDKENHGPGRQEQLRTISPDRSQRKRRSPMEASFSEPSSIEEEGAEENISVPDSETEVRLQETTKDNSVPVTNGTASSISDGQPTKENGSNGLTYIYDSVQKTFSAQSPKAPFAKKKIKISNGVGDVNSDSQVEIVSESRGKNEEARVVTCQIDPSSSQATVDEAMEVDNSAPDNLQENNIGVLVLQEKFQVEGIFQAPLNKDPSPEPFSAVLPPVKAIRGVKRENDVVKEKSQNMESKEPKVEPGVEPKDIVQNVGANALISSEPKPSTSVTPLQVLNKSEVEVKTCPKDSIMEVDVKPLHKSSSLEPPQKPSPLEPTHKPSSLEPTHKLSSLEPTHKLSSLEPTHKPSSLEPPHKPSSLEPTHKPSSLEPTHKPSSLEPTHKLSSLEPTHKPSSLEPTHKLSSLEPPNKPSSLEPTHKLSSLEPTHKPSSLEPTHKPSSLESTHKLSSLQPTHKLSSLEPTHKPSSLEPTHKPSSLESTHKLSSLESLQKHSPLKPPQKPSPLKPTHKPTTLEHPHKPSSLEPTHKPSPLKPPHKSSSVEPTHKSSSVEATHKPSPLKPINKPSSLIPQHKPSSLEPTHKPSLVEPQHKPSSLEPTHKLSLLEPTNKPSSLELTHKPSSGEPTHKLSSVEPQHKPSLLEPTHKPSSVEPTHKPSSVELPHKPSSLEATHKSSSVEPQHKPTLLKPQHKPSSMELSESIHSTLVNKSKVTVEDRATVGAGGLRWDTSINGAAAIMGSDSAVPSCDRGNGFPQHPCEQSRDQLSGKETSSSPKNASVSLPLPQAEVTQAHTQTERNEAPVNPEPLTTRSELDVRSQQQPPLRTEVTTDALQTPTLHNASRTAIDKMTPRTWGHSEGSMESHTAPFTETLKSPLESQGDSENSLGCNISPTLLPGQEEIAIKTVGGTKIQDEKIVDGTGGLRVQNDTFASSGENKTDVEMERTVNQLEKQNGNSSVMDVAGVEMVKKVAVLKTEKCLAVQKIDSPCMSLETIPDSSPITDTHSNPSAQKTNNSKDLPKSVVNVMSVAELLRAQLKAFNATLIGPETPVQNPVICFNAELQPTLPKSAAVQDNLSNPMIRMETELNKNSGKPKIGKETNNCSLSAGFDILSGPEEHRRDTETKLVKSSSIVSPVIETLTTEVDIPSISIRDECNTFENRNTNIEKENDCVMDTGQDVPLEHKPSMCLIGPESIQIDSVLLIQNHKMASGITPISVPPLKSFQEHKQVQGKTTDEIQSFQFVLPKVSSQDHQVSSCPPLLSSLSCDTEKHSYTKSLTNNTQAVQTVSDNCSKNTQPDTAMFVDQLEGHQHDMPQLISQKMQTLDSHVPTLGPETQEPEVSTIHLPCSKSKDIKVEDSKIDYLVSVSNTEESSLFQKGDSAPPLPSATPQELASGARRKIFIPKSKGDDADITPPPDSQSPREEVPKRNSRLSPETPSASPSSSRRSPLLQPPSGQGTPFPAERRSPLISRRKAASDAPKQTQEPAQTDDAKPEDKQTEKDKHNPFKAPQVIRKIRGEPFSDASGHLKLWCQFFNVLSDSTIKWYRDDVQIAEIKRSAGDETQVALAIAQTSSRDCGVYGCTIHNEYGTDSTDFLLSADILAGMFLREELEVGEEIEMTPLLFSKGLGDSGLWGSKFFGRIMMIENHIGEGCSHKTCRAKVIYGLEPVFESGTTCIIKVHNPIAYGAKEEGNLIEKNLAITQLECRIHNIAREYCKIFAAETRVIENFGPTLEVIPRYLMYRPANTIPHATVEADLTGVYLKYCFEDVTGRLIMRTGSEVELKCCALQHWVHQWTNGNLLLTHLEGVDTKITNVGISIQTKGYQGLAAMGNPKVFEQFVSQHQCNYYCGLLSLRVLKAVESLQTPIKPKGSRSPMLNRKITPGSSSPQTPRKATASPRVSRKSESEDSKAKNKCKTEESPKVVG